MGLSREQRGAYRKSKNGKEVAHVRRDSDTIFKVKRSKFMVTGAGHIVAASPTQLVFFLFLHLQCWLPFSCTGGVQSRKLGRVSTLSTVYTPSPDCNELAWRSRDLCAKYQTVIVLFDSLVAAN